jgi:hypothetical protein
MLSRCVPIYWGARRISDFFDARGIYTFQTIAELDEILKGLNQDTYDSLKTVLDRNQALAYEYLSADLNIQNSLSGRVLPARYAQGGLSRYLPNLRSFLEGKESLKPNAALMLEGKETVVKIEILEVWKKLANRFHIFFATQIRYRARAWLLRAFRKIQ